MNKPCIFNNLPDDVLRHILRFVPPATPKKRKNSMSPSLQKELFKIQNMTLKGKNNMYMRDFEDFLLD
jgi:hypothetical protein